MTTPIVGVTSPPRLTPYISLDMFKFHSRRGVDVERLVPKGTPDQQDAALAEIIERASVWVDSTCQQILAATADTVLETVNVGRRGYAYVHPRYRPIIAVTAVSVGATPSSLAALTDLSGIGVQEKRFAVPTVPLALQSFSGPIQFGGSPTPSDQAWVKYTYQNGFPVTTLTASPAQSAVSVSLLDTTGIVAGLTYLTIYALQSRFRFLAGTVSTAPTGGVGTGPGTVVCPALPYAIVNGNYPTMVTALPPDVIEAVVLVTRAFIKDSPAHAQAAEKDGAPTAGDDLAAAWEILHPYVASQA